MTAVERKSGSLKKLKIVVCMKEGSASFLPFVQKRGSTCVRWLSCLPCRLPFLQGVGDCSCPRRLLFSVGFQFSLLSRVQVCLFSSSLAVVRHLTPDFSRTCNRILENIIALCVCVLSVVLCFNSFPAFLFRTSLNV